MIIILKNIFRSQIYCKKIVSFVHYFGKQISSYNCTAHNILISEISLILPNFPQARLEIALLISAFNGLAYEGISSFLHNRRHKALHKAVKAMENKVNLHCNKLIHIEDSVVMYGIYNAETLERIMHNVTIPNERLFDGKLSSSFTWYLTKDGVDYYTINSLLYLRTLRERYAKLYEEFIIQLCMYTKVIRILSKGYLSISVIPPSKLQERAI